MELSSPSNPDVESTTRPSRRKSGRVVKAPEVLGAKRKRVEATDADDESQPEVEDSEGEPDEEELRERKRQVRRTGSGKGAPKRAKTDGVASQLVIRPAPKATAKTSKKAARPRPSAVEDAVGLYADVFASQASIDDIVGEWLKRFGQNEEEAVTEIINFVLRSTSCTLQVDVFDIRDPDNCSNKLSEIQDEFQTQNIVEYPLIDKHKNVSTTFRRTLTGFFNALIHGMATSGILYKFPELMENIQSWVGSMSSAASRPFRHTATIISTSIISALGEVGRNLVNTRAKVLRQSEGELKKKSKTNQGRIAGFQTQANTAAEQKVMVDNHINDWFDIVFVHRYRDVDPRIRLDCMTCLGDWIMTYPDHFLDGAHLRYLGWVLSDIVAGTRLEVVKQLHRIFKDEDKIAGVRVFTERFRPRMVEMAVRDADSGVRAAAVELLDTLREAGMLEPNDIDTVGQLIYDTEIRVRKAVVSFFVASIDETLSSKVEELGGQEVLDETWPADAANDDYESPRVEWLKLKCLAELLRSFDSAEETSSIIPHVLGSLDQASKSGSNSRYTVAALSLLPKLPVLKQWEILAGYLLFDHSVTIAEGDSDDIDAMFKRECKLENKEEIILLDVLNTAVKHCLTDMVEEGSQQKKNKKSKAELVALQEEREEAAQRLAAFIPKLLKKFGATPDAASAVLRLQHVLNLDIFHQLRQDSTTYSALLDDINKQFMSHENQNVLLEASKALQHAKSFEELGDITETKVQALWDDVVQSLHRLCHGQDLSVRGGIDRSTLAEISSTVLRISNLARISDCTEVLGTPRQTLSKRARDKQHGDPAVAPVSILIQLLGRGRNGSHVPAEVNTTEDELVSTTMICLVFYFMWCIIGVRASISSKTLDNIAITALAESRSSVAMQLDSIIAERQGVDSLRIEAAGVMMDLHNMFITVDQLLKAAPRLVDASTITHLSIQLSPRRQTEIQRVFAAVESDFARKTKRKLEEALPDDEPEDLSDDEDSETDVDDAPTVAADAEDDEAIRRREARVTRKEREQLLAEEKLCMLASKMVIAIRSGVLDQGQMDGTIRQRLSRNRAKMGHNFKEIVAALDKQPTIKGAASKKNAVGKPGPGKGKEAMAKKSAEVAMSDVSDDENDQMIDEDDEESLRARGLLVEAVDDAAEDDGTDEQNGAVVANEADVESLLGD